MRCVHLFEFTDLPWYPRTFRRMQTDYLQFGATLGSGHKNIVPLLVRAMQHAGTHEIVDLCSGGSGPWLRLQPQLAEVGWPVTVLLTDKYPTAEAEGSWAGAGEGRTRYLPEPVDATDVPPHLSGMRTLFEGLHHFRPEQARAILGDAVRRRVAIGVFEAGLKPPLGSLLLLLSPLVTPLGYFLLTPFMRPRTFARFFWTYLVPAVPLATTWDGIVSLLRVYSTRELEELAASIPAKGYTWEIGLAPTGTPVFDFVYLVGYPE